MSAQSPFYYAIENLDSGAIVQRGGSSGAGIPSGSLILSPDTRFREWLFQADNGFVGYADFETPSAGRQFSIPTVALRPPVTPDVDGDGLSNDVEFILGTDPKKADSDGDGITDGAAVQLGIGGNSLGRTGVLAVTDTPGNAVDVAAANDIAVVADSTRGVSVFNIFNRMEPLLIAQVATPSPALAVAISGNLVAVSCGTTGLAVVDLRDPPNARILHQVDLASDARVVAAAGGIAFVGTGSGELVTVDLETGVELTRYPVVGGVQSVALEGDFVYVVTSTSLLVFRAVGEQLQVAGNLGLLGGVPAGEIGRHLSVADGLAYVGYSTGFSIVDVTRPEAPSVVAAPPANQAAVHRSAPNGSGLLAMITSVNGEGTRAVSLYDVSGGTNVTRFLTSFPTPTRPRGLALYNGLAYVAGGEGGLQVIAYRATDIAGRPPSLRLTTSFPLAGVEGTLEEGQAARVSVVVTDDVQARNVEFYLDDDKIATDGNPPFEFRFVAPPLTRQRTVRLQARASDTGGNFAFSDTLTLTLLPDTTPPAVRRTSPGAGSIVHGADAVFVFFSEPVDAAKLTTNSLLLFSSGSDHQFGTGDDFPIQGGAVAFRESLRAGVFTPPTGLSDGWYRLRLVPGTTDIAGNRLATDVEATFWVLRGGPGGDADSDGLTNRFEVDHTFNPTQPDTDGDGWDDGVEYVEGLDYVTDPRQRPRNTFLSQPPLTATLPGPEEQGITGGANFMAQPPLTVRLPGEAELGLGGRSTILALPPVLVALSGEDEIGNLGRPVTVARPPLSIAFPGDEELGRLGGAIYLARPPVVVLNTNNPASTR